MLDTDFDGGALFHAVWRAWQLDPSRPRLLHYVGIASAGENGNLEPGFHRMALADGRVSLTLCVGAVQTVLAQQRFQADTVFAGALADKWLVQQLARCSKRGTRFALLAQSETAEPNEQEMLQAAGFALDTPRPHPATLTGSFNPRWTIATSRTPMRKATASPARCAVVGGGIAGACVAHALALRGWSVTVFDKEAAPAAGASGVPAGLVVPHVSTDDSPRSRLSRSGCRLMLQLAQRLLVRGQDWDASGVMEKRRDAPPLWHPHAGWIKPAKMVAALLSQSGVSFAGMTDVHVLERNGPVWRLRDERNRELGPFERVVMANALGCAKLIRHLPVSAQPDLLLQDKLAALQAVHGTLSHGVYAEDIPGLPATPWNGNGCFIPHLPGPLGEQWLAGATYETDAMRAADSWAQHAYNMGRLQQLLPAGEVDLAATLDRGPVALWSATRCVTHDRLPLVGPLHASADSGLWLCVGMGSRGLSFAALCAELLVAQLCGEPWPLPASLARSLDAHRNRKIKPAATNPLPGAG
jgi:tRNA 5-methylaminomethyl-2-thiouridine biosynthesis bifunctional protein